MEPMKYELIEPQRRCTSPDGHSPAEIMRWGELIPERAFCARCGQRYTIVTFSTLTS